MPKTVKDHLGNEYGSMHEMCEHYGIKYGNYKMRRQTGMTMEEALTTPLKRVPRREEVVVDHLGNKYTSEADMAKAYSLDPKFLHKRLAGGMDLEKALTQRKQKRIEICDHKGIKYETMSAMCKAYGWDHTTLHRRMQRLPLQEALEGKRRGGEVTDHNGKKFRTQTEMCKYHGIDRGTFKNRIRAGWDLKDALETPHVVNHDLRRRHLQRIGEKNTMSNGLEAEIIRYKGKRDMDVRFEDGVIVHAAYKEFQRGNIGHPGLNQRGYKKGSFMGFDTKRISKQYFECVCRECGLKKIMTPKQMIMHKKDYHDNNPQ